MVVLLVQQKVAKALDAKIDQSMTLKPEEIAEMKEIAFSTIILYLANNVLRQINDQKQQLRSGSSPMQSILQNLFLISCILRRGSSGFRWIPLKI